MMTVQKSSHGVLLPADGIIVYPSRVKLVGIALASLVLAVFFWFAFFSARPIVSNASAGQRIIAGLFDGLLMVGTVVLITRALIRRPLLVISHEGLRIASRLTGPDLILWGDVTAFWSYRVMFNRYLAISFTRSHQTTVRLSRLQRGILRYNNIAVGASISIIGSILPMSIDDLLVQIQNRFHTEIAEHHVTIRHKP